jgi:hypothetical protein
MYNIFVFLFVTFAIIGLINCNNNKNQDRNMKKRMKHSKPAPTLCKNFEKDFNPKTEIHTFYVSNDRKILISRESILDAYSFAPTNNFTCNDTEQYLSTKFNSLNITWRYQFLESAHCIRVELDFVNTTRFQSLTNFTNYRFSYRELGKHNSYLKKHIINKTELNRLTIHQVKIRPYIICVSFYKHNNLIAERGLNDMDSSSYSTCPDLYEEERVHDNDLCIDIDIHSHFLGFDDNEEHSLMSNELLMVLFILCLLGTVLTSITIANYFIMKPKEKSLLRVMRQYINNHRSSHHGHKDNLHSMTSSRNSIQSKSNVIYHNNGNNNGHNPAIMITDCSNNSNASLSKIDEPKESEPLLSPNSNYSSSNSSNSNGNNASFTPSSSTTTPVYAPSNPSKVRFHIEETIIEESPNSSKVKLSDSENNPLANENDEPTAKNEEECIGTISHILDDKPWLSSSASVAQIATSNRNESRVNLTNNGHD